MKHKFLSLFIAIVAMTILYSPTFASVTINGIAYELYAPTATVVSGGNYTGTIVIPSSVTYNSVSYSVTSIGGDAFAYCSGLTSVTIPNSVTSIGGYAFYGCSGLTSVTIPGSVTSIAGGAFRNCSSLTSVTIPNSVTSIGGDAFRGCTGLTSVEIPNSVTSIGGYAFCDCTGLTSPVYNAHVFAYLPTSYSGAYTIPDGIESIAGGAFRKCSSLTSVTIPNSVTSIGNYAFYDCTGLTGELVIPNSVTSIGAWAFEDCSSLTSVEIPNSVTSIGKEAFCDCTGLTSPVYNAHVFAYLPTSYSGAYTIPDGIESIAGGAFRYCSSLTSVTIPNSVTSIADGTFEDCSSLTSVTIPNSVTSIGAWAFEDCSSLTSVEIPNSVTSIGKEAFRDCTGLTSVTIPNSVTSIGYATFYGCSGLTSVTIPNSVTSIGDDAFYGCSGLTSVTIEAETPSTLGSNAFYNTNNCPIYVPCSTLDAYKTAWSNYASRIQYGPLEYHITGNVNIEGSGNVQLPQNKCEDVISAAPNYGYHFVRWNDGNTDNPRTIVLTQDTTMEAIFDYLLEGKCGKDSALTWTFEPASMALNIIGKGALSENYTYGTFIESLTIGNEVSTIGQSAFYGCNNLKNVIIGSSVKVLEEGAFYGCSAIETITCYGQRPPTVNQYALYGLDYSTIVYVPADYLETYKMHDAWGLYDVRPLGAKSTETTDVNVTPAENTAEVAWPAVSGAATYELVIKDKSSNVICTLIFNANGQLTSIAFAPSRNGAPQQTQAAGFSFTVTGLEEGTSYDLTITSKDNNGGTLDTKTVSFTTTGDEGIEDVLSDNVQSTKFLLNGQVFILRGDNIYTITGAEVK